MSVQMKIDKIDGIKLSAPPPDEWRDYKIYLVFSLILGLTSWLGFYVQPAIYHGAAAVWHSTGMLTDVFTCGLPLFNWGLALASLANFFLFSLACFKPGVLGRESFIVASLMTVLSLSGYIMNLLVAYSMTAAIFPR
jgi:hypothetical protein